MNTEPKGPLYEKARQMSNTGSVLGVLREASEPILRPDDLDYVEEQGVVWLTGRERDDDTALECRGCGGAVDEGLAGSYCRQCIYCMER